MSNSTQITKGEKVNRWTNVNVDNNEVVKHHVTQHGNGNSTTYHELTWHFDFSNVTQHQLLELASRDLVIKCRPAFKQCPTKEIPGWDGCTFDVAEMLQRERKQQPPVEKAKAALSKLSDEERQALLDELNG